MSDQFLPLVRYIKKYIELSDQETAYLCSLLHYRFIKKKQIIVQPGFVCKYRTYIVKGSMRAYLIDQEGNDHTLALGIEDWWISDYYSYIHQVPADLFVEALEDSYVIQMDYNAELILMETYPKFERFFRILSQRALAYMQRRILSNLSKSAGERYEEFSQKYPLLIQRIPQYAIASYLGFSSEFLSKIKKQRVKKVN